MKPEGAGVRRLVLYSVLLAGFLILILGLAVRVVFDGSPSEQVPAGTAARASRPADRSRPPRFKAA